MENSINYEYFVEGDSLPHAYHKALKALQEHGNIYDCADWNTTQKELSMTMVVKEPLKEPMISKLFIGGPEELEQYRQEILHGILDFEIEKGNWTYTYHDRMVRYPVYNTEDLHVLAKDSFDSNVKRLNQIDFVIEELRRNPSSRRAVMVIRDVAIDAPSSDPACLQHIQYIIRDNRLHCKILFRSNDACKATFMNAFALIMLQKYIADELGVETGTYTHRANSFHCYAQDYAMLDGYVGRLEAQKDADDNCYDYEGDWKDEMEEFQEEIAKKVEVLRHN